MKFRYFFRNKLLPLHFLLASAGIPTQNMAQNPVVESFESSEILTKYKKSSESSLSLSSNHYQFGKTALQWKWNARGSSFGTSHFRIQDQISSSLVYNEIFPVSPVTVLSVYSVAPQEGTVTFSYHDDGVKNVWFSIPLNFKGWRTIRIPFFEMEGDVPNKSEPMQFDYFMVTANNPKGILYFDDIVFSQYMDDRHPYPDLIVPFIKEDQHWKDANHWMPLLEYLKRFDEIEIREIGSIEKQNLELIERRINEDVIPKENSTSFQDAINAFKTLGISEKKGAPLGPPLTHNFEEVYFDSLQQGPKRHNDIQAFGRTMYTVAAVHNNAISLDEKRELERMFLLGVRYFLDQGWQSGSSGGTRHHIGYSIRQLTRALYIMRDSLDRAHLLEELGQSLQWLNNLGKILGNEKDFEINIDYLNTQSYYDLLIIFLTPDQEKKVALLKAYTNYISTILSQEDKEGGFKPDGTAWHHSGHYPAYSTGAFFGGSQVIYTLSGTLFRIKELGFQNFKRALLATSLYSHTYDWGFGNAGRHPKETRFWSSGIRGGNNIYSLKKVFYRTALGGNNKVGIDEDIASAYLRLWGDEDSVSVKRFTNLGIRGQKLPGYKTFPYAATSIHRRDNWAAIMKGYSKYLWSSEIYSNSNRYGRYPSNGTIQLLDEKGEVESGFVQSGWDWNRYPGATIIYLPLEKLETEKSLLMFQSQQSFVGSARLGDNGVFAMVLDESGGTNADGLMANRSIAFPEKLRAKKSVFSFGDKLICIGTNISSVDSIHPAQTNLFQSFLKSRNTPIHLDKFGKVDQFPFSANTGDWIIDPIGNGYHVISGEINVEIKQQYSYHNKYSVRTGAIHGGDRGMNLKETRGDFATAWLDHGMAPKDASYQYIIYPFLSVDEQQSFAERVKNDTSFTIHRADKTAHIVSDKETFTTAFVVFESNKDLKSEVLKKVSDPSIIMLQQKNNDNITISVVQPDLNFPVNTDKKNKYTNYSQPVELSITLKGKWNTKNREKINTIDHLDGLTIINVTCRHGSSNVIPLYRDSDTKKELIQ